jgi:hypothetical protein
MWYSDAEVANRDVQVRHGAAETGMNEGQIPNVRGARVHHVSTGYNRVEGNRRAS